MRGAEKLLRRVIGEDVQAALAAPHRWAVSSPSRATRTVLLNLAVNDRDAMPLGGTLLIETRDARLGATDARAHPGVALAATVALEITDSGSG